MQGTAERREIPEQGNDSTVAFTYLTNGYIVSTIRLGRTTELDALLSVFPIEERADLSAPGDFETMVFAADSEPEPNVTNWRELDFARYSSEAEALAGHETMVERWLAK